jgi:hypothetical protein
MASTDKEAADSIAEFQRRTRDLLRSQQEAYLAAVKAWRGSLESSPTWPQPPAASLGPNANELAEASYAFAAKLLADQSRFMDELSKAMADINKKT